MRIIIVLLFLLGTGLLANFNLTDLETQIAMVLEKADLSLSQLNSDIAYRQAKLTSHDQLVSDLENLKTKEAALLQNRRTKKLIKELADEFSLYNFNSRQRFYFKNRITKKIEENSGKLLADLDLNNLEKEISDLKNKTASKNPLTEGEIGLIKKEIVDLIHRADNYRFMLGSIWYFMQKDSSDSRMLYESMIKDSGYEVVVLKWVGAIPELFKLVEYKNGKIVYEYLIEDIAIVYTSYYSPINWVMANNYNYNRDVLKNLLNEYMNKAY